jgi:drug/metabolite transporter (DMT)-like permease
MAVIGRIVFKEAIRLHHLIGLILLLACAAIISLSDGGKEGDFEILGKKEHKISAIYAVGMALLCPITFAAQNFIVRIVDMSHSYNPIDFRIASQLFLNGVLIIVSIFVIP